MGKIRKTVAAGLVAGALATGLGVAAAPAAQAAPAGAGGVQDGQYNYVVRTPFPFNLQPDTVTVNAAWVQGDVLSVNSPGGASHYRIITTPYGGYADVGPARLVFARDVNGSYSGQVFALGIPSAWNNLFPR